MVDESIEECIRKLKCALSVRSCVCVCVCVCVYIDIPRHLENGVGLGFR